MPRKRLEYEHPSRLSQPEARRILSSGSPDEIERALVSIAFHEEGLDFALEQVLACTDSAHEGIRGTAILCLGHLARIHGRLPPERVINIVRAGLQDPSDYVRGQAENAADDIEIFIPSIGRLIRSR